MRKSSFLILFFLLLSLIQTIPAFAQKVDIPVNGQRVYNTIAVLASDAYLGRKPNTPEYDAVLNWITGQYTAWGLEPADDNGTFLQAVPIQRAYAVTYGTPRLVIGGREFFARFDDFSLDTRSVTGKKIKGTAVFAGYGISSPEKGLDEYAGLDVRGKFVLVLKGNPNDFNPPRSFMLGPRRGEPEGTPSEKWIKESMDSTKIAAAYQKGAAGILFFNPAAEESGPFRRPMRPGIEASPFQRDFFIVSEVSERVLHWLLWTDPQMSERGFTTWMNLVQGDIKGKKARSFDTKLKVEITGFGKTVLRGEKFNDGDCRNVIAKITGSDPILKDQYVVMGAHLDHVGVTNGQIYNGAEDNASGSAAVMEVARLMKENNIRPRRTVIFCLWTGEELGLIGSRYWVEHPTDGAAMDRTVAYFNMDMVAIGNEIDAPGALNFPLIWEVIKRDQDADVLAAVKPRQGGPGGSDHSAFIDLGIEALALMTGGEDGHPDYHDTGDDVEKLDTEIMRKTVKFVLQGTVNLANENSTQLLIADRQDIYSAMRWNITVIDPDLGMERSWSVLEGKTSPELTQQITDRIGSLKQPRQAEEPPTMRRFMRTNLATGVRGGAAFDYNTDFMKVAKEALDFGRIDFEGDDGVWFDKKVTDRGAAALAAMEEKRIVLHMIRPEKATLLGVLEKAKQPFLVSGFTDLCDSMITKINRVKALVCVDFDSASVENTVKTLVMLKEKFGDTDNLLLNVTAKNGLEEAKRSLYFKLIREGWKKVEIYAIGGASTARRGSGNLDRLTGGRPAFPPPMDM